jgi:hypothetical protein
MWHRDQTGRVHVSPNWVHIDIVDLFYAERIEQADESKIELAVCQKRSRSHAITHTIGEHWGIFVLEPTLRPKDFRVLPYFVV